MIRRLVLIFFVVASVGYRLSSSSPVSAQKAGWMGKILTEAGVRVVSNPEEPL